MTSPIDSIIPILAGASLWVWVILAYLLFIGIKATKQRKLHPLKLFIVPIIFTFLNYKLIFLENNFCIYIIFLIIGYFIGFTTGMKVPIKVLPNLKHIELPGNYYTIALLMLFFVIKYAFGYLQATEPSIAVRYLYINILISGSLSGFFLGISSCYLIRYYKDANYDSTL